MSSEQGEQQASHPTEGKDTTRREFLQGSLAVAGTFLAAQAGVQAEAEPATAADKGKRPNLVFFLAEGQRASALSLAGNKILQTPNHDRIGKEGAWFRNAFCTNALCAPARSTILTGMYSRATGALSNEYLSEPLPADIPLFTDLLREAGYEIALVGKTHGQNGFEERHWDYYFGHNDASNNYVRPLFKEGHNGQVDEEMRYEGVNQEGLYPDDFATDHAIAWLESRKSDKPFCLLVWFVAPHEPFFRARRHFDLYRGTVVPIPSTYNEDLKGWPGKPEGFVVAKNKIGTSMGHAACGSLEGVVKDYYAGLTATDENVGKIFHYLETNNILDDTAIIQTSDHGYFLGEWRMFDKRLMHEPSIRVPLLLRYPKRIPAGTVRDEMVLDIDLAPTFLDLAGVPVPEHMHGKSLLPTIAKLDPNPRKEWYYEYFEWVNPEGVRPHRGIRTEQYKLIHYVLEPQEFEMYDIASDPEEKLNLYGNPKYAELQQKLWNRMQELQAAVPERPKIVAKPHHA